jgi:hypothetical protein
MSFLNLFSKLILEYKENKNINQLINKLKNVNVNNYQNLDFKDCLYILITFLPNKEIINFNDINNVHDLIKINWNEIKLNNENDKISVIYILIFILVTRINPIGIQNDNYVTAVKLFEKINNTSLPLQQCDVGVSTYEEEEIDKYIINILSEIKNYRPLFNKYFTLEINNGKFINYFLEVVNPPRYYVINIRYLFWHLKKIEKNKTYKQKEQLQRFIKSQQHKSEKPNFYGDMETYNNIIILLTLKRNTLLKFVQLKIQGISPDKIPDYINNYIEDETEKIQKMDYKKQFNNIQRLNILLGKINTKEFISNEVSLWNKKLIETNIDNINWMFTRELTIEIEFIYLKMKNMGFNHENPTRNNYNFVLDQLIKFIIQQLQNEHKVKTYKVTIRRYYEPQIDLFLREHFKNPNLINSIKSYKPYSSSIMKFHFPERIRSFRRKQKQVQQKSTKMFEKKVVNYTNIFNIPSKKQKFFNTICQTSCGRNQLKISYIKNNFKY